MRLKLIFLSIFLNVFLIHVTAQQPIRKGVMPIRLHEVQNKSLYTLAQLKGKWQEVKRTPVDVKDAIGFSDTLLMMFDSNKVEVKDAISMRMSMKGLAQIEYPNYLNVAGDDYNIIFLDSNKLVLNDGEYIKEMQKRQLFYRETLGKLSVEPEMFNAVVTVEQKNCSGKWIVYRRQAVAGSIGEEAVIIKSLDIFQSNTDGSAPGQVVFYQTDITESLPCRIIFGKGNMLVITDKYTWDFNTYKANGNEFVFGETGKLVYYSKH